MGAAREILASASRNANGDTGAIPVQSWTERLSIAVDVTVATAGSLDVAVEWSTDDGATWFAADPADSFAQITVTKKVLETFDVKAPTYRVQWTIVTGPFTFAVDEVGVEA